MKSIQTANNLQFINGSDLIPKGRQAFKIQDGVAYFKTTRGVIVGFLIKDMHEFYFNIS